MALLAVCADVFGPSNVDAVYLDHGLRSRDAVANDVSVVRSYCEARNIAWTVRKLPIVAEANRTKDGFEAAGREWRYRMLVHLCGVRGYTTAMTAHHRSDVAETILLKIVRGSGHGLSGIQRTRIQEGITILRPFLDVSKAQLQLYCDQQGIPYVIDESNFDLRFSRNRIRQRVIPELQAINPEIERELIRFTERVGDMADYVRSQLPQHWISTDETDHFLSAQMIGAHRTIQHALLLEIMGRMSLVPSSARVNRLIRLLNESIGKKIQLSKRWYVIRTVAGLRFTPVA
jgi:tRNA(Ile)-lysidine synthase